MPLLLVSCQVVSHSFATPWTAAPRVLCQWDFLGEKTGMDCHFLLQGIFLTQGSNCDACSAGGLFTPAPPGKPMEDTLVKIKDTPGRSPCLPSTWPQVRSATEEGALFSRSVNRTELCNPAGPCAPATKETLPSFSLFHSPFLSSEMRHIASLYVLGQYGCQINSESGSGNKRK